MNIKFALHEYGGIDRIASENAPDIAMEKIYNGDDRDFNELLPLCEKEIKRALRCWFSPGDNIVFSLDTKEKELKPIKVVQ